MGPELIAIVVVAVLAVGMAGALVVALFVAWFAFRRARGSPAPTREEMLRDLGYTPIGADGWSRPIQGTSIVFSEKKGRRWTIRLPRYNTLTLQVEERTSGKAIAVGREFTADEPALDERFVMGSELAAQTVALVRNRAVANAMLDLPHLSLRLRADEVVIDDADLRGSGGEAEQDYHQGVAALVLALFGAMYSKTSGTILPDFR